jgi:hypothetical protein
MTKNKTQMQQIHKASARETKSMEQITLCPDTWGKSRRARAIRVRLNSRAPALNQLCPVVKRAQLVKRPVRNNS